MSRMRLLCLDVEGLASDAADEIVRRTLAQAGPDDRVLCFGRATRLAGRFVREDREAREGAWLDAAASWLLTGQGLGDPPARPGTSGLAGRMMAIGVSAHDAGGVPVCEHFVELVGGLLVMAVANEQLIDEVDNAHLWLVGGRPFGVDTGQGRVGGRAVVGVGGVGVLTVVVDGHEAAMTPGRIGVGGDTVVVPLGGGNRMSVRSATP